jgi:hypothetical protein
MGHGVYEVPAGTPIPTLEIDVQPDPITGANLNVSVNDFDIAPEHASTEAVPGEGHFHAYINGEKVARFYNEAMHLKLDEGEHTVMVELSANNHSPYAVDGEPITATATVVVPAPADNHHHREPVEAAEPIPTIELSATVDPISGWNLFAEIGDFTFAPDQAGFDPTDGEGHTHLYVDGQKVARLYGPWWHLKGLSAGTHEVTVELTTNDHVPLAHNGEPISSTITIDVSEDAAAGDHSHSGHDGDGVMLLDMDAADADVVIDLSVTDGNVTIDSNRFEVEEGQTVGIIAASDEADRIHVHGYEVLISVSDEEPVDVAFTADQTGVFEVELEDTGMFLFEILVR